MCGRICSRLVRRARAAHVRPDVAWIEPQCISEACFLGRPKGLMCYPSWASVDSTEGRSTLFGQMSCKAIDHGSAAACRCPYYETAQDSLYGTLAVSDTWDTAYWDALLSTNLTAAACGISLPTVPNKFKSDFFADINNPTCGEYLQLTSLYPGRGPCYPVVLESVDYFNRCSLTILSPKHACLYRLCFGPYTLQERPCMLCVYLKAA